LAAKELAKPTEKKNKFLKMPRRTRDKNQMTIDTATKDKNCTGYNFILLQWLVVDGFQRCNLKLLFRQTRLSSPDSAPLQAIQFR